MPKLKQADWVILISIATTAAALFASSALLFLTAMGLLAFSTYLTAREDRKR